MRLYFDRALRSLVVRPGFTSPLTSMSAKRGDEQTLELRIYDDGDAGTLGADPVIRFGIKETLDGDLLAIADTWTLAAGVYTAPFNTNTVELLASMADLETKVFLAELTYTDADGGPTSSQTIPFTVLNDVLKEEDGTPTSVPGPDDYVAARAVLYDRTQALSDAQKLAARANIAAARLEVLPGFTTVEAATNTHYVHGAEESTSILRLPVEGAISVFLTVEGGGGTVSVDNSDSSTTYVEIAEGVWCIYRTFGGVVSWRRLDLPAPEYVDLGASSAGGGVALVGVTPELVLWNSTRGIYQILRLTGLAGAETITISDLP